LGKILANGIQFAKFAKVFPRHDFALYVIHVNAIVCGCCVLQLCMYMHMYGANDKAHAEKYEDIATKQGY